MKNSGNKTNWFKFFLACSSLFAVSFSTAQADSLCDHLEGKYLCDVSRTTSLIDTQQNFEKNFIVVEGDHVGTHEHQSYRKEQVTYNNGKVEIKVIPQAPFACLSDGSFDEDDSIVPGTCIYKSGAIYTRGRFDINANTKQSSEIVQNLVSSGAIEVEATIAEHGKKTLSGGLWPALWMMSNNLDDTFIHEGKDWERKNLWPSAMEIDVLEFMKGSSDVVGTLHYGLYTGKAKPETSWNYTNNKDLIPDPKGGWEYKTGDDVYLPHADPGEKHSFGLMWDSGVERPVVGRTVALTWFFDGRPYFRYEFSRSADTQQYSKNKWVRNKANTDWKLVEDRECIKASRETVPGNRCPDQFLNDSESSDKLAEAMFRSFQKGFDAGYYLVINLAVGGDGVVRDNLPPAKDINDTMTIHSVKRFVIDKKIV